MSTQELHATGPVDPQQAWERYLYPARWPEWSPQITGVDASADRLAPGVSGKVHAPLGLSIPFVVESVDEQARRWSWRIKAGPVSMRLVHWVEVAPTGGTTTGLRVRVPRLLVAAYAPAAQAALEKLVQP